MDIGLVGLGKMGGNRRRRLRNAGHTVIVYDRNPELSDADGLAAMVDKVALIESVKRVALVAERNTAVQLAFADGVLTLDAGSGEEAMASESIEAAITGDDITTGFNPAYLLDGLTAIESPFVELAFTQASKPVVLSGVDSLEGDADSDFRYLLMPRRLLS